MLCGTQSQRRTSVRTVLVATALLMGCGPESDDSQPGAWAVEPPVYDPLGHSQAGAEDDRPLDGIFEPAPPAQPPSGGSNPGDGTPGAGDPGPVGACDAVASGMLWESQDPISYDGQPVAITATHVAGLGCLSSMTMLFLRDGGCPLRLTWAGSGGTWSLQSASLRSDAECGTGWGSGKEYTSSGGGDARLTYVPSSVAAPAAVQSCTKLIQKIDLNGTVNLSNGGSQLTVALTALRISGAVLSDGVNGGSCDQAPAACVDVACGNDIYGNFCGSCGSGLTCQSGSCVQAAVEPDPPADPPPGSGGTGGGDPAVSCPPNGTGTTVGTQIKDATFKDSSGTSFQLHDYCGATKAIFIMKTAAW